MAKKNWNNQSVRGILQSGDGIITKVFESNEKIVTFESAFKLSDYFIERLKFQPQHIIFSERSRIARLGIQIKCDNPNFDLLEKDTIYLKLSATSVIHGYPELDKLNIFFTYGLPIGRLVFCDPKALLSSDELISSIEKAELKLPASTAISSDGSILIAPHKSVCELRSPLDTETLGRILLREDGRELLNRYQIIKKVQSIAIPPKEGIITTCSMYLNEHYVVLQSKDNELGSHLPATILDPIKTRGIRIYLEIVNTSEHPIVNPLISAKIYHASKIGADSKNIKILKKSTFISYDDMKEFEKKLDVTMSSTCHYLDKPASIIPDTVTGPEKAQIFINGPSSKCRASKALCSVDRRNFSPSSLCPHAYATHKIKTYMQDTPIKSSIIALKYFPNIAEHHDIIDLACDGNISALYFFEPSYEHGPFLSERDHNRLQEYQAFGLEIYWVSRLNNRLMIHTIRDNKGYFVMPERLFDFHKSMLFAFYGSNKELSNLGVERLGSLMDSLINFWGKNIGIVTGGGSGVMGHANMLARKRGILSGANFLDITDQAMTTDVDFCQVFQSSCRHSRQKWFEIASFPIFNVGGLGSLEEVGITLCNMKLSIMDPVPVILFDTEGDGKFWSGMEKQIKDMVINGRAPAWIMDNIFITNDPQKIIDIYREKLQLF